MYITLNTTFTSTCYILTKSVALDWEWRGILIEVTYSENEGEKENERQTERNIERQKERKKERKKENWDKTVIKVVIKYIYITLNTTFTSTCYILTNKCFTCLRMTSHLNRRNLQGKRVGKKETKTDREKERKKERKKEYWQKSVTEIVITYMYIILNTTFTSTCYILTNKCCT